MTAAGVCLGCIAPPPLQRCGFVEVAAACAIDLQIGSVEESPPFRSLTVFSPPLSNPKKNPSYTKRPRIFSQDVHPKKMKANESNSNSVAFFMQFGHLQYLVGNKKETRIRLPVARVALIPSVSLPCPFRVPPRPSAPKQRVATPRPRLRLRWCERLGVQRRRMAKGQGLDLRREHANMRRRRKKLSADVPGSFGAVGFWEISPKQEKDTSLLSIYACLYS